MSPRPRPDLADVAYARLAGEIAGGAIPAGAPLNEREVSIRLGMSRTPLRAALHRLALEGLVVTVPNRGTSVAPLDPCDVEDSMAVREALEIAMAERVIADHVDVDPAAVDELLALQQRAIERLDSPAFLRADEQFHIHLLAAAGNRRAVEAAQRSWLHVSRARCVAPITLTHMRDALRGHRDIAAALQSRSLPRTRQAIHDHLDASLRHLLAHQPPANGQAPRRGVTRP